MVTARLRGSGSGSHDPDDCAFGVAAKLFIEVELLKRRFVAGDEQEKRLLVGVVRMFEPGAARDRQRVERAPVVTLAVNEGVASTLEWRHKQASGLAYRQRPLARSQHLHEKGDGLEHRL